ncbi:putative transcriptional regulator [Owenweeksia hongkongensis DSM 17368]|uniref:Putative transcriptional regulator n=1 Tax=Owenweeksia hongkongensis (strain DSM 17368 / CIP 108786 / JCM 12287 / NRRL B-23963 / UST20020801) TaxID=926562 RepID=G8R8G0_OWEHD|nr:metalloregulator ArsR/SmtB family transcription factor [Owenweeksia hongkongensis]AEV33553.1 putative transcriptional regulator [Owenweeksia hongkongensis DSM 17368]
MGVTRTDLFTQEQNQLADLAKVLGHPARIAILEFLLKAKSCINNDLVEETGLAQATISQHLQELKKAGLIQGTIDGTRMCYCIEPSNWKKAQENIQGLFDLLPPDPNCC